MIGNPDGWSDQNSYAGPIDGEHWCALVAGFEEAARRHRLDGRMHAVITADRMAATAHVVMPDQMMAAFEIVEAGGMNDSTVVPPFWKTFDGMCERFASGYSREMQRSSSRISLPGSLVCNDR